MLVLKINISASNSALVNVIVLFIILFLIVSVVYMTSTLIGRLNSKGVFNFD